MSYIFVNKQSSQAVQNGTPMMIFPQGSRRRSQKLPFKNGAYRIAMQNKSDIIPVSIHVPDGCWNSSYPFNLIFSFLLRSTHVDVPLITMTIHKPIKFSEDTSLDQLREKSMEQIYSVLPPVCDSTTQISTSNKEKVKWTWNLAKKMSRIMSAKQPHEKKTYVVVFHSTL